MNLNSAVGRVVAKMAIALLLGFLPGCSSERAAPTEVTVQKVDEGAVARLAILDGTSLRMSAYVEDAQGRREFKGSSRINVKRVGTKLQFRNAASSATAASTAETAVTEDPIQLMLSDETVLDGAADLWTSATTYSPPARAGMSASDIDLMAFGPDVTDSTAGILTLAVNDVNRIESMSQDWNDSIYVAVDFAYSGSTLASATYRLKLFNNSGALIITIGPDGQLLPDKVQADLFPSTSLVQFDCTTDALTLVGGAVVGIAAGHILAEAITVASLGYRVSRTASAFAYGIRLTRFKALGNAIGGATNWANTAASGAYLAAMGAMRSAWENLTTNCL